MSCCLSLPSARRYRTPSYVTLLNSTLEFRDSVPHGGFHKCTQNYVEKTAGIRPNKGEGNFTFAKARQLVDSPTHQSRGPDHITDTSTNTKFYWRVVSLSISLFYCVHRPTTMIFSRTAFLAVLSLCAVESFSPSSPSSASVRTPFDGSRSSFELCAVRVVAGRVCRELFVSMSPQLMRAFRFGFDIGNVLLLFHLSGIDFSKSSEDEMYRRLTSRRGSTVILQCRLPPSKIIHWFHRDPSSIVPVYDDAFFLEAIMVYHDMSAT